MSSYGQVIDSGYEPYHEEVYKGFADYFQNPDLLKVKDVENLSMYATRIFALLGFEQRYLIAMVPKDTHEVGYRSRLADLSWTSLQTRTLTENYNVLTHNYMPRRTPFSMKRINMVKQTPDSYLYDVDNAGFSIILLPTSKQSMEYSLVGTVATAIETYQTIIKLN